MLLKNSGAQGTAGWDAEAPAPAAGLAACLVAPGKDWPNGS